jgi:hypothetical protein
MQSVRQAMVIPRLALSIANAIVDCLGWLDQIAIDIVMKKHSQNNASSSMNKEVNWKAAHFSITTSLHNGSLVLILIAARLRDNLWKTSTLWVLILRHVRTHI